MDPQIFSKAYLQKMPVQSKMDAIDRIIMGFMPELKRDAVQGKTSYMYVENNHYRQNYSIPEIKISKDDLINRFQEKFPDCLVFYEEGWIDHCKGKTEMKILRKGIVIDWS